MAEPLWETWREPIGYDQAMKLMRAYVKGVQEGSMRQRVMLLQHSPVYTSPQAPDNASINGIKLEKTSRGGSVTYHGPGQRVIYPVLDLNCYKRDLHWYVSSLEGWIAEALLKLQVPAFTSKLNRGIWLEHEDSIAKLGSIGVRIEGWVTSHGCAVNISNSLEYFSHINPCGMQGCKVVSCKAAGYRVTMEDFDQSLIESFSRFFKH